MGIVDSKDGTLSIFRLVIMNAILIAFLGWLINEKIVALRPAALIAYPVLLISNFVVIWKAYRDHTLPRASKITKRMWSVALVFTTAAFVEVIYWVRSPDLRSSIQAIVGIALAGWMWYLAVHNRGARRL